MNDNTKGSEGAERDATVDAAWAKFKQGWTYSPMEAEEAFRAGWAARVSPTGGDTPSPLEAQVREALAIIEGGSDYERVHVAAILRNGLAALRSPEGAPAGQEIEGWARQQDGRWQFELERPDFRNNPFQPATLTIGRTPTPTDAPGDEERETCVCITKGRVDGHWSDCPLYLRAPVARTDALAALDRRLKDASANAAAVGQNSIAADIVDALWQYRRALRSATQEGA